MTTTPPLSTSQVTHRIATDHDILLRRIDGLAPDELAAAYRVESGPLGDFCESLHDLLAHVLMWDEIGLAVLAEHRAGRRHWSLAARWETPEAGRMLNRGGVLAGRELPPSLLRHRLLATQDALLAELDRYTDDQWRAPGGVGVLAQYAMTVPGQPAYVHAAVHLGELDWLPS